MLVHTNSFRFPKCTLCNFDATAQKKKHCEIERKNGQMPAPIKYFQFNESNKLLRLNLKRERERERNNFVVVVVVVMIIFG